MTTLVDITAFNMFRSLRKLPDPILSYQLQSAWPK